MKLIFLDIDGVLNYEGYERFTRMGTRFVDPVLIKRLKKIIDCTGAKVVLSSTWRRGIYDMREGLTNTVDALDAEELLTELNKYGIEIFDMTHMCGFVPRAEEIRCYLDGWKGDTIEQFVILDGLPLMSPYESNIICTDCFTGLSEADVVAAIELLGGLQLSKAMGATVIIQEGMTAIPDEYFFEDRSIERVYFPNSVESVGKRAFVLCKNLKEVYLPDKIISLGKEVFKGCVSLESISLPNGIITFGTELFADCTALKDIKLPASLRYISYGTFYGCTALEKITLPESVELIGKNVFHGCTSLKEIAIPPKVEQLDELTFYGCTSLKRIYVSEKLSYLKKSAFMNCPSLKEIIFYLTIIYVQEYVMGKKKERAAYLKKLQRDGVDITPLIPSKNLFVRFWEWLSGIPRDIRHFLMNAKCAN